MRTHITHLLLQLLWDLGLLGEGWGGDLGHGEHGSGRDEGGVAGEGPAGLDLAGGGGDTTSQVSEERKKIERQREREREREIRIRGARARARERGVEHEESRHTRLVLSPFFFPSVSPYRTALAVLTLCSFVLAVALVTTLLVVCLLQHTPLALVTPEVIIIIIILILTSSSCGVRARACVHWLCSCCVWLFAFVDWSAAAWGFINTHIHPQHRDFYSKKKHFLAR